MKGPLRLGDYVVETVRRRRAPEVFHVFKYPDRGKFFATANRMEAIAIASRKSRAEASSIWSKDGEHLERIDPASYSGAPRHAAIPTE